MDGRPRLLYVYANSEHAVLCSRFFRRQGWNVHLAMSPEDGVRLADVLSPAVVMLDSELPGDCVAQASSRIERAHPEQKVVILSREDLQGMEALADLVGGAAPTPA
jgi:DNA-binding response OmpR family regulator